MIDVLPLNIGIDGYQKVRDLMLKGWKLDKNVSGVKWDSLQCVINLKDKLWE
jgi:hypothetical protein